MKESDTAIRGRVTKPRIFDEAFHFRAREGTKDRLDALRGSMRQGDFIRLLIEEALDRREAALDQREDVGPGIVRVGSSKD